MKIRCLAIALALTAPLAAQSSSRWGSYNRLGPDAVDRSTLGVRFSIPIFNRNTGTPAQVGLHLVYNSQGWYQSGSGGGWSLQGSFGNIDLTTADSGYCGWYDPDTGDDPYTGEPDDESTFASYNWVWFFEPGGGYAVGGASFPNGFYTEETPIGTTPPYPGWVNDCGASVATPAGSYPLNDHSGYSFVVDANQGLHVYDASGDEVDGGFRDRNGNAATVTYSGGTTTYSDPLGAAVTATGSPSSYISYEYTGPGGAQEGVDEYFETLTVGSFGCSLGGGQLTVPSEIGFANGSWYHFQYDDNGRLDAITLPTGGTIHYTYALDCGNTSHNSSLSRWDSVDGAASGWSWALSDLEGGGTQTVETTPYQNDAVYTFDLMSELTEADQFSGSHLNGTLLKKVTVTGSAPRVTNVELAGSGSVPAVYSTRSDSFDAYSRETAGSVSDWSTSPSGGATLRGMSASYTYTGYDDELTSLVVSNPDGSQAARTDFAYDPSGDVTSVERYTSPGAFLAQTYTYNANGTVATATGPNGGVTTYTYGDCGGLLPTQVTGPPAGGHALWSQEGWDCTGGVPLSTTGPNGWLTGYSYGSDGTPASESFPDRAAVNLTYPSPTQEVTNKVENTFWGPTDLDDSGTTFDALGRPIVAQASGLDNGERTVETYYDAMGRVSGTTVPYAGTWGQLAPAGTGRTTITYDALSRPVQVTDGGGGWVQYSYAGNDVLRSVGPAPAGENLKQTQIERDGLGRLTSVCEITAGANGGHACAQMSAATGYYTVYTLDALGAITAVAQNVGGSPVEYRSFVYDELGRLTSETNPETGNTGYWYGSSPACPAAAGNLSERSDNAGNVTCYAYDPYNRVTQISYPAGPNAAATPTKTFVYDLATVNGQSMKNAMGHLAEAYTGNHITDLGFSYPSPTEVQTYQSSPNSGGYYVSTEVLWPGGRPYELEIPGLPNVFYGPETTGGTAYAGPGSQGGFETTNYSALGPTSMTYYDPTYGTGPDTDTFSYDSSTGRLTQYQFGGLGGNTDTGTYSWNANGSLAAFSVVDTDVDGHDSQNCSYTHDDLGRLASANCGPNWSQVFSLDPFGNSAKTANPGTSFSASFNADNEIASVGGTTGAYDADGNLLNDPSRGPQVVNQYDAEGRPVEFEGKTVTYDALGRAVEAGGSTQFLYGPGGGRVAIMEGQTMQTAFVPLPGGATAVFAHGALESPQGYLHPDGLGSARVYSDSYAQEPISIWAFAPQGEAYDVYNGSFADFTGARQDTVSGQYDFRAREYSPVQGRWWTPDPAGLAAVDPANPQSWNRYAYALGNPLTTTDPTGLDPCPPGAKIQPCFSTTGTPKTPPPLPFIDAGVPDELTLLEDGLFEVPILMQFNTNQPLPTPVGNHPISGGGGPGPSGPGPAPQPAPSSPAPPAPGKGLAACTADTANSVSAAGALHHVPYLGSGVGGFIANAAGGNVFSGATNLLTSVSSGSAGGHSVFYQLGLGVARGPLQGLGPAAAAAGATVEGVAASGPVPAAMAAIFGEYSTGVGEAKVGYDFLAFIGAAIYCLATLR